VSLHGTSPWHPQAHTFVYLSRGQIELLQNEHPKHKGTKGQRDKGLSLKDVLCTFDPLSLCDEKAQFVTVLSIAGSVTRHGTSPWHHFVKAESM
jgi:hypothetical protein